MFIAALILAVLAVVFFLVARGQAAKALDIGSTKTSTVAELGELAAKVAAEIGAGSFAEYAEVKGRSVAEVPMRAEYSGTDCVWYECVASREYEEEYWEEDSQGHRERKTRRGSEEVSRILRDPPFLVDDGTGRLRVDPKGAAVEPEKSFSRFEPGSGTGTIRVGSFSLDLGAALGLATGGRRTLGYKFEERCIPADRELYLLGQASDSGGSLVLRKPDEKGKRFIVSLRSEEAILAGAKKGSAGFRIAAAAAALAAAALAVVGFLRG